MSFLKTCISNWAFFIIRKGDCILKVDMIIFFGNVCTKISLEEDPRGSACTNRAANKQSPVPFSRRAFICCLFTALLRWPLTFSSNCCRAAAGRGAGGHQRYTRCIQYLWEKRGVFLYPASKIPSHVEENIERHNALMTRIHAALYLS